MMSAGNLFALPVPFIRTIRLALDHKQETFAEMLGIRQSQLSKLEKGYLRLNTPLELRFCAVVQQNAEFLRNYFSEYSPLGQWIREVTT